MLFQLYKNVFLQTKMFMYKLRIFYRSKNKFQGLSLSDVSVRISCLFEREIIIMVSNLRRMIIL